MYKYKCAQAFCYILCIFVYTLKSHILKFVLFHFGLTFLNIQFLRTIQKTKKEDVCISFNN